MIGDVTGHGPDAAALGASLRAAWRALALRGASLQASMKTLNSLTLDESDRAEQGELGLGLLATVCSVEIDAAGRHARFVNAGHPQPLLLRRRVVPLEHAPDMMLGVEQYGDWAPHEVTLPDGVGAAAVQRRHRRRAHGPGVALAPGPRRAARRRRATSGSGAPPRRPTSRPSWTPSREGRRPSSTTT